MTFIRFSGITLAIALAGATPVFADEGGRKPINEDDEHDRPAPLRSDVKTEPGPAALQRLEKEIASPALGGDAEAIWKPEQTDLRKFLRTAITAILALNADKRAEFLTTHLKNEKLREQIQFAVDAAGQTDVGKLIDQSDFRNRESLKPGQQWAAHFEIEARIHQTAGTAVLVDFLATNLKMPKARALKFYTELKVLAAASGGDPDKAAKLTTFQIATLAHADRVKLDAALAEMLPKSFEYGEASGERAMAALALASETWMRDESKIKDARIFGKLGDTFTGAFKAAALTHRDTFRGGQEMFWSKIDELVEVEETTESDKPVFKLKAKAVEAAQKRETLEWLRAQYDEREITRFAKSLRDSADPKMRALGAKLDFAFFRQEGDRLVLPLEKTGLAPGAAHQGVAVKPGAAVDSEVVTALLRDYDTAAADHDGLEQVAYDLDPKRPYRHPTEERRVFSRGEDDKLVATTVKPVAATPDKPSKPGGEWRWWNWGGGSEKPKARDLKAILKSCSGCHQEGKHDLLLMETDLGRTKGRILDHFGLKGKSDADIRANADLTAALFTGTEATPMADRVRPPLTAEERETLLAFLAGDKVKAVHEEKEEPPPTTPVFTFPAEDSLAEALEPAVALLDRWIGTAPGLTADPIFAQRTRLLAFLEHLNTTATPNEADLQLALFLKGWDAKAPIQGRDLLRVLIHSRAELEARLEAAGSTLKPALDRRLRAVKRLLATDAVHQFVQEERKKKADSEPLLTSPVIPDSLSPAYSARLKMVLGSKPVAPKTAAGPLDGSPLRESELAALDAPAPQVRAQKGTTLVRTFQVKSGLAVFLKDEPVDMVAGAEQLPRERVLLRPFGLGYQFFYTDAVGSLFGPLQQGHEFPASFLGIAKKTRFQLQVDGTFTEMPAGAD